MRIGDLISALARPSVVKYVLIKSLGILGNHNRVQADYELNYRGHAEPSPQVALEGSYDASKPKTPKWHPFPRCTLVFRLCRAFENLYMFYIILKYFFSKQIANALGLIIELKRPIHCYLVGRYILHERLAEMSAVLFSVAFLVWRLSQALAKPHPINLVYFMMQDDEDREWLYSHLESQLELQAETNYMDRFSAAERFLIDTMCYKVIYSSKVVFKLRANRTREASAKLSKQVALLTLVCSAFYVLIASVLIITFSIMHLLDQRYLRVYANCDPDLERLKLEGKISKWSMTLNPHHRLTIAADIIENCVIWIESGLVLVVASLLVHMSNYDLVLQWLAINDKIAALERALRERPRIELGFWSPCQQYSYELSAEIADFIAQTEMANRFLNQFLNTFLIGSLSLCAIYTYTLERGAAAADRLPLELVGVILCIGICIIFSIQSFLKVHRVFTSSHTTLCSLIAHDGANQVINYGALLEFFVKRRECALMMNKFRFVPTTCLTLIGWVFSCFCYSIQQATP